MCTVGISTFTCPIARGLIWSIEMGPVTGESLVAILGGLLRKTQGHNIPVFRQLLDAKALAKEEKV
jgi:hypothetical protein